MTGPDGPGHALPLSTRSTSHEGRAIGPGIVSGRLGAGNHRSAHLVAGCSRGPVPHDPPGGAGELTKASWSGPLRGRLVRDRVWLERFWGVVGTGGCPSVLCGKGRRGTHLSLPEAWWWLGLVQTAAKAGLT